MAIDRKSRLAPLAPEDVAPASLGARFQQFLAEHRGVLVNFLARRTSTREDAEDAAQESFVRLLRYQATRPSLWKPLLFRIARNVAIDQSRRAQTHLSHQHEPLTEVTHAIASTEALPDQRLEQEEELAALRALILTLPPRCREVFLLNRIQCMSFVEIARHLEISTRAVEKHVARALKVLRQGIGRGGGGPF
jgi:RNA polymerase sigma-70 factor (ECF subfamily)